MSNLDAAHLFSVKGLVAVVTGASSGIGEIMAHTLDVNGAAKVFILGRREAKLKEVAAKAKNNSLIPIQCDTTSKPSLAAAASAISAQTPFINILCANAGYLGAVSGLSPRPSDTTLAALQSSLWDTYTSPDAAQVVGTNISGSYFTFLAFLNLLAAGNTHPESIGVGGGLQSQFVTTGSPGGLWRAEGPSYVYNASKAGLHHLTKVLGSEFARWGVRCNAVAPGTFVTEMTEVHIPGKGLSVVGSVPADFVPATRLGKEEDIAGAVLYLASKAGAYVNGCILIVDGGCLSVKPGSY